MLLERVKCHIEGSVVVVGELRLKLVLYVMIHEVQ